jgi:hypothetical protein
MIQIGDLVKSKSSGKVGIVTGTGLGFRDRPYCTVLMHDARRNIYASNLKPLETK